MTRWAAAAVALFLAVIAQRAAASLSDRQGPSNYILGLSTSCSAESMNITVRMRHPFRGIVYSRGFPLECSTAREQHHKLFHFLQQKAAAGAGLDGEHAKRANEQANEVPLQPAREVMLSLPASECGIRLVPSKDGEGLWLQTSIVVQLDRHLQQAADQTRTASCHLPAKDSSSSVLLQPQHNTRTGRQFGEDIPSVDFAEASAASWQQQQQQQQQHWQQRARAVMEILSTAGRGRGRDPGVLAVGEEAALVVTSHLPAGVGSRVTDCFAHDGAGEGMERLSDARGCPTDRLILPQLREVRTGPPPPGDAVEAGRDSSVETRDSGDARDAAHSGDARDAAGLGYEGSAEPSATLFRRRRKRSSGLSTHVSAAKFAAFKFPDRSRLHLRCQLQLCRGACPQDSCLNEKANTTRQERRVRKGEQGEVLGRLQVFNSVEVLAPGIEVDDRLRLDELTAGSGGPSVSATQERTFCLSPARMALALAALGSVLLCAVAAALYTLVRGRRKPLRALLRRHFQYGGSQGSSASLGERNVLVRVQDSPFGQAAASPPSPHWQDKLFH